MRDLFLDEAKAGRMIAGRDTRAAGCDGAGDGNNQEGLIKREKVGTLDVALAGGTMTAGIHARVLLVEDQPMNQAVALKLLKKLGCSVAVAGNGFEAVVGARDSNCEVIFMDCMMPGMDGFTACRRIREFERDRGPGEPARRPLHIIALTANAQGGDREECLAAGMNDYLSKPIRPDALRAALERWQLASGFSTPVVAVPPASATREVPLDSDVDLSSLFDVFPDDPAMVASLVSDYVIEADQLLAELDRAVASRSAEQVEHVAHRWAGASSTCGVRALVEPLASLEEMAEAGDLQTATQAMAEVRTRWLMARPILQQFIKNPTVRWPKKNLPT